MTRLGRVAHFLPFPGIGGTEKATLRLAHAIRLEGVESVALCLEDAPAVCRLFADQEIETLTWHARDPRDGWRSYAYRTAHLAWQLRQRGVRVVHCADSFAVTPQVVAAARLAGAALVCHVRNRNTEFAPERLAQLQAVHRFIFVSKASWNAFGMHVPPERGAVVYDGVVVADKRMDAAARATLRREVREEFGLAASTPLIGMVARVEEQKDFATLARAARRVLGEFPDARFLVIGGTDRTPEQREYFPRVQGMMAESGVTGQVIFTGFRSDVPRLLRALDISLLTTNWEGLPLVLWEAMAEGIPVVATAVDGVPEAIEDGVTGFLVGHGDDEQAADRLRALLGDPTRATALGEAGQAHARQTFDPARFGDSVLRVYREAVTSR